ncbi:carbohydrate ABC transporter substrate-binding protein [bacterium D16-54]|nr:carbohydrate ABC transporter substrate-binding protein [bacterium D16-54]RKJ12690.1 carbohydrate ABC transporter substrate-binding protein [bacterium D16-56]
MKKRLLAVTLAAAMTASLTGCGDSGTKEGAATADGGVSITIFNSKIEVQAQFEEMAKEYSEATGVDVEVYYSNDTVAAHLATKYSSNDPYTLSMVDAKDVYSLAEEHAVDLTGEKWVENTKYAISVGDKVVAFPVCVEARGLIYNADAIEKITGEKFNPEDYATLDAFQGLLDELAAGGMETPVGIMKEDWSLAGHFLSEVYEMQEDVDGFISSLHAGSADLANNAKWNGKMDYFDTMMKYNYAASSAIAAEREVSEQKLAEGEIAFMFGGNWDWSMINAYDHSENMGIMPVPENTTDGTNKKLVGGGSKYFFIDSSENTSEEQRQAAKDFLNWLVFDEAGNSFLTEKCALVPAYSNIAAAGLDPLSVSVKAYADAGNLIDNYNYLPDDHFSLCGAAFQKYLAGQTDRAGLASEIENYWSSTTPVEH